MKKLVSLVLSVLMLILPGISPGATSAFGADPRGTDISAVHAPRITEGGLPSDTDFLTGESFAAYPLTIINVWSDGCSPCVQEMPVFQRLHEEFADYGVQVIGCCSLWIDGSFEAEWELLKNRRCTYLNVIQDDVLFGLYSENNYIPQTFFVNSEGVVIDFIGGSISYEMLTGRIAQWLSELTDYAYDVQFVVDKTGEVFEVQSVHVGETPVYPTPPQIEGLVFMRWFPAEAPVILRPTTIIASYAVHYWTVRFYDSLTGERIGSASVQHGCAAEAPAPPEHEGFVFTGWDLPFDHVTSNLIVNALYEPVFVPGDADGNSTVDSLDALMALRHSLGISELTAEQLERADMNGDGAVDSTDALSILRIALGIV